jgi:hypothetical protein
MVVSVSMDLVVALWRIFAPVDLVVVLWKTSAPMDLVVVLWRDFCSYGLGCRPMEEFLDLIKSWESSDRLNLLMSLLVAISLLI